MACEMLPQPGMGKHACESVEKPQNCSLYAHGFFRMSYSRNVDKGKSR